MKPIMLYELKTVALTVTGIPATQLPVDVDLQHVKNFMHASINSYWQRWIHLHSSLANRKVLLILFPGLTEWGVLGIARQVYTLKQGTIVSKKAAGYGCLTDIPAIYRPALEDAIHIRMNTPSWANYYLKNSYSIRPSWQRANQTIDCMQYLIDLFNTTYLVQR